MEEVLQIINQHAASTGNLSGISAVQVSNRARLPINKTRQILREICNSGKARVREGINGYLVFGINQPIS